MNSNLTRTLICRPLSFLFALLITIIMLTTKPLITVSEHFTTSNKNPRHVTCALCKHDYCYRSHPEMLRHVVGGYSGFALCGGKISPSVYKKYEQQAETYDL